MRHSATVRFTHWISTFSFFALLISGIAILLAHPRLYWGETGNLSTPSLIDLPLPFLLTGQSGWGRSLHFLSAWIAVVTGMIYVASGHFRNNLFPPSEYNTLQRWTYLTVIFVLFPAVIWTGLAMSPAIVSVFPWLQTVLGGQQSARTIHFVVACLLVVFVLGHVTMVVISGFATRTRAMIVGKA